MQHGDFVWYELCTTDPVGAASFYEKVVGWTIRQTDMTGMDYRLACVGEHMIAGLMTLPPEQMPPRPVWLGYIAVDDVDAKAEDIKAAGGAIHKMPTDIPMVGRFAVVADPQGAVFMLFKGAGEPPAPLAMMQPGTIGWHELHSKDWETAWPFYERMFGWSKDHVVDMGPMGQYQIFKASANAIGGMMTDARTPHPYWLYYFAVEDIDAGLARVTENGGAVLFGPQEVPGGGAWVVNAQDPQGGVFALVGMKKS